MTTLTTAKKPVSIQQYKNLIATRDMIKQYPDHYCQKPWCSAHLYTFAGFALMVKEGNKVGEVLPLYRNPNMAEWLGMTPNEYTRACYGIKSLEGLLSYLESLLGSRIVYDEHGHISKGTLSLDTPQVTTPQVVTPQVTTPQVVTPKEKVSPRVIKQEWLRPWR
jgi:hypothetical protein